MADPVLVDTNVILDISTQDARWFEWSANALEAAADESTLVINPIIYDASRYRTYFPRLHVIAPD